MLAVLKTFKMTEIWNWYINLFSSSNALEVLGVWTATITTAGFLINYIIIPPYNFFKNKFSKERKELKANNSTASDLNKMIQKQKFSKSELLSRLKKFKEEAEDINVKVLNNQIPPETSEIDLVQWKIKVVRFLEKYVGITEAESFLNLRTSLSSGVPLNHFKSAYSNHIGYLDNLIEEIESDSSFEVPNNERSIVLNKVKFIYN